MVKKKKFLNKSGYNKNIFKYENKIADVEKKNYKDFF